MKSDEANVQAAAINLGYTKITSPVDGRVGLRQVDLGNIVSAGQTNGIVVVTQEQPISVLFSLPEDNIGDVMDRINADAILTVYAYDRGQTKLLATGTLSTVDNQIDTTTGTVKLRAQFDNSKGELFPNQFVNVRVAREHAARPDAGAGRRRAARRRGHLCLRRPARQHRGAAHRDDRPGRRAARHDHARASSPATPW